MVVTINNKEYEFAVDSYWGPLYEFEIVSGGVTFDYRLHLHLHIMFWVVLYRCNKGSFNITVEDFLKLMEDLRLATQLTTMYNQEMTRLNRFSIEGGEGEADTNDDEESKKKD